MGRSLAIPIKTTLIDILSTAISDSRKKKKSLLSLPKIWVFIWTRSKCFNYSLWLHTDVYLPYSTGLNTEGQKQAMAFTASKLYQCQKFVEKQYRVIPAEFFQMLYFGHSCCNSSCKDQCCSHYSSNEIESFVPAGLSRHCLLPLPVV